MDYFNDLFTVFLGLERVSCIAVYAESESFQISQNILICVTKMNEGLKGLEHKGEKLMRELKFLGELSL